MVMAAGALVVACSSTVSKPAGDAGSGAGGGGGQPAGTGGVAGAPDGGADANGGADADGSVGTGARAISINSGFARSCAVIEDGTVRCWGNLDGFPWATDPLQVPGIQDAVAIACGTSHTCALRTGGTVSCWGDNHAGQLGDGSNISRSTPAPVSGLTNVVEIAAGWDFSCARLGDKTIRCWGANEHGQLGNGVGNGQMLPGATGVPPARRIIAAIYGGCAIADADATVWCWGDQDTVTTGADGGPIDAGTPHGFPAPLPLSAKDVARTGNFGLGEVACAVLPDNSLTCWSIPFLPGSACAPRPGPGPCFTKQADGLVQIAMDGQGTVGTHGCGITQDGHVACWGSNQYGELGSPGDPLYSFGTITVPNISDAKMITSGGAFSCALVADGSVWCWGRSLEGQLAGASGPGPHRIPL